jgi:hypothetical protein
MKAKLLALAVLLALGGAFFAVSFVAPVAMADNVTN